MIYCKRIVIVPTECQSKTGRSGKVSRFLLNRLRAYIDINGTSYLFSGSLRFLI
jgi:hypothetical protein